MTAAIALTTASGAALARFAVLRRGDAQHIILSFVDTVSTRVTSGFASVIITRLCMFPTRSLKDRRGKTLTYKHLCSATHLYKEN